MKESKFIELLNLYIDQQITPEDAALLEEEILQNREHRKIYRQYCRMHRACVCLHENFRAQSEQSHPESEEAAGKVVELAPRQPLPAWIYYASGLAACAAIAAVWMVSRPGPTEPATVAAPVPESAPVVAAAGPETPEREPARVVLPAAAAPRPGFATASSLIVYTPVTLGPDDGPLVIEHEPERSPYGELVTILPPPTAPRQSLEDFVFERQPVMMPAVTRTYRVRSQNDARAEMTAFQFQR